MSSREVLERLEALDLSKLTEEERLAGVAEVRAQLEVIANSVVSAELLTRKIAYLKLWQRLVSLRVKDVKADKPPPHEKPVVERMFPASDGEVDPEDEPAPPPEEPAVEEPAEVGDGLIKMRLLENATVRGVKLPSGVVIEVEESDARDLLDANKAVLVKGDTLPETEEEGQSD